MIEYNVTSKIAEEFINDVKINETLEFSQNNCNNLELINAILEKAEKMEGLSFTDALMLLDCRESEIEKNVFALAKKIKEKIYGDRIVMFAPLYLSNYCVNGCTYCPFHMKNKEIPRRKLSQKEIENEVIALQNMGHKRLALEAGEDPKNNPIEYILESIETIYNIKNKNGAIRRVNVNIAGTTVENYRKLRDAGIGTYILFQETYNKNAYEILHPTGPKSNYAYHTESMDRAMQGGIDDVGIGVLFGLNLYRYDFVGMLMHADHLEKTFGVGPHTVSVPRIRPASDVDVKNYDNSISDDIFKKIVAILRISLPYAGIIVSTRESEQVRADVIEIGVSQISGGSKTSVGGYSESAESKNTEQFEIDDNRTLDEIVRWLLDKGFVPSFCTACYREGRVGDRFMRLAKSGQIGHICEPNALITLKEYLNDYATDCTKLIGNLIINQHLEKLKNEKVKDKTKEYINLIDNGERDFRF